MGVMSMELFYLCLKIFFCRIVDVSMASYRTVIMVKGKAKVAAAIALVECLIWFLIVREALNFEPTNIVETLNVALAYAGGFSWGTYIGARIANKFIDSMVLVQVVTSGKDDNLIKAVQEAGFATTIVTSNASEYSGEKYMLFCEMRNKRVNEFKKLINSLDQNAFVVVNESKLVYNGFIKK